MACHLGTLNPFPSTTTMPTTPHLRGSIHLLSTHTSLDMGGSIIANHKPTHTSMRLAPWDHLTMARADLNTMANHQPTSTNTRLGHLNWVKMAGANLMMGGECPHLRGKRILHITLRGVAGITQILRVRFPGLRCINQLRNCPLVSSMFWMIQPTTRPKVAISISWLYVKQSLTWELNDSCYVPAYWEFHSRVL